MSRDMNCADMNRADKNYTDMIYKVKQELQRIAGADCVRSDEPMAAHTTFRVGGPADIFVTPADEESFIRACAYCRQSEIPYMIIGNGSNLLVGDKGIRGVVFQIFHTLDHVVFEDRDEAHVIVRAGAGMMLSKLSKLAAARGLCGLAFASGIPGTFGGAVTMNAGAYGGEMQQCIVSARVLDTQGQVKVLDAGALEMGYRTSIIQKQGYIVLEASLCLKKGDAAAVMARIDELTLQRKAKQPLEYPSAGSTFKRPEGYFAGKLIQDAGLKGYRVGGACVSEKHSGFVINDQNATAAEILQLIHDVQRIVYDQSGVRLEPEVRITGEF